MSTVLPLASAEEVCRCSKPSADGKALCSAGMSTNDFLARLLGKRLFPDALGVAAHMLPKREAIWWGTLCAWHGLRPKPGQKTDAALRAVVTWLGDPSEANRRAAQAAGEAATAANPAGAIALAAFYSEGSISLPGLPEVHPPPLLAQNTIAGAVLLMASTGPHDQFENVCRHYVGIAHEVAQGKHRWK
jgi:hypothetical protein